MYIVYSVICWNDRWIDSSHASFKIELLDWVVRLQVNGIAWTGQQSTMAYYHSTISFWLWSIMVRHDS